MYYSLVTKELALILTMAVAKSFGHNPHNCLNHVRNFTEVKEFEFSVDPYNLFLSRSARACASP